MAFKVVVTSPAQKDIKKFDQVVKKRIFKKILIFSKDPLYYGKKLTNSKLGDYRWRTGKYRIVFSTKGKTIFIFRIRHRKEIYK